MTVSLISMGKVRRVLRDAASAKLPCPTNGAIAVKLGFNLNVVSQAVRSLAAEKRIVIERDRQFRRIRVDGDRTDWSLPRDTRGSWSAGKPTGVVTYDTRAYEAALRAQSERFTDSAEARRANTGRMTIAQPDSRSIYGCAAAMTAGIA